MDTGLDHNVIDEMLRDRGINELKPFHTEDTDAAFMAYFSKEETGKRRFHICDRMLKEKSREEAGLQAGPLFILVTKDGYALMKEHVPVKGIHGQVLDHDHDDGWLVDCNGLIVKTYLNGFFRIADNLFVLYPDDKPLDESLKFNVWRPDESYVLAYEATDKTHPDFIRYYGSLDGYYVLWSQKKGMYALDSKGRDVVEEFSMLWQCTTGLKAVSIDTGDDAGVTFTNLESKYAHTVKLDKKLTCTYKSRWEGYGDGSTFCLFLRDEKDCQMYGGSRKEGHLFLIDQDTLVAKDTFGEDSDYVEDMEVGTMRNGVLVIKETRLVPSSEEINGRKKVLVFTYHDYAYHLIAEKREFKTRFIVVSRENKTVGIDSQEKDVLYGVFDTQALALPVPIQYNKVEILSTKFGLYAAVGMTWNTPDGIVTRYGLYYGDKLLVPVDNDEIHLLHETYKATLVTFRKEDCWGLTCKGKVCVGLDEEIESIKFDKHVAVLGIQDMTGFYDPSDGYLSNIYSGHLQYVGEDLFVDDNVIYQKDKNRERKAIIGVDEGFEFTAQKDDVFFMFRRTKEEEFDGNYICLGVILSSEEYRAEETFVIKVNPSWRNYRRYCLKSAPFYLVLFDSDTEEWSVSHFCDPESDAVAPWDDEYFDPESQTYYDPESNSFVDFEDLLYKENDSFDDQPDDYDYERDTYYALGGDNYESWRDGGGNIDDMMDGMGY